MGDVQPVRPLILLKRTRQVCIVLSSAILALSGLGLVFSLVMANQPLPIRLTHLFFFVLGCLCSVLALLQWRHPPFLTTYATRTEGEVPLAPTKIELPVGVNLSVLTNPMPTPENIEIGPNPLDGTSLPGISPSLKGTNTNDSNAPASSEFSQDGVPSATIDHKPMGKNSVLPTLDISSPGTLPSRLSSEKYERDEKEQPTGILTIEIHPFSVPKEGDNPALSEDKYDYSPRELDYRLAVADGVGGSFLPGQWANCVATGFVEHEGFFETEKELQDWLLQCSQKWQDWVENTWVPRVNKTRGVETNWQREIDRGAQTTLIACAFSAQSYKPDLSIPVDIFAVGDANSFRWRPSPFTTPSHAPDSRDFKAFPWKHSSDFGPSPKTLTTSKKRILSKTTQERFISHRYVVKPDDYIFLCTDALAQWILLLTEGGQDPWRKLLSGLTNPPAFRELVDRERHTGKLEVDDTTLIIIRFKKPI